MQAKITKRTVDAVAPGPANYVVRDSEVKGFILVVTPAGQKAYAIDYRAGTGRGAAKRRYTIGTHGSPWTPEEARKEAKRLLALVDAGKDPLAERHADRQAQTFGQLIDLYLAEGVSHKKPSTLKADRGRINHHLRPLLGTRRVDAISRADIERMRDWVAAGKTAQKIPKGADRPPGSLATGGKGVAAQCVALAGSILSFAVDRGIRDDNPAARVRKAPVRKIERFLSEQEMARLGAALDAEEKRTQNPYPAAAVRLLMFTGCRKSEIVGLQWQHVDFERGLLALADSKTGKKTVFLAPPAIQLLSALPRIKGNPHVIAGSRAGTALVGLDKIWFRLRRAANLPDVRLHDLRHNFASVGAAGGMSLPVVGALLGHKHTATTARYAHLSADPLRSANDQIAAVIARAIKPNDAPPAAEIVDLEKARAANRHA